MNSLDALQAALAGEHAALYGYGVLGGRVSAEKAPTEATAIAAAYTTHRARRDQLTALVTSAGGTPVAPEVAYTLDGPVERTAQIIAQALVIETRCAELYAQVVASTTHLERRWGAAALTDAAVRSLGFGGEPTAFPGAPEL